MSPTWQHVFVVFRLDDYLDDVEMVDRIVIKEVLPSAEEAQHKVDRLNELVDDSGRYLWKSAKYYPQGRSIGED